jgi:hypothetical protein
MRGDGWYRWAMLHFAGAALVFVAFIATESEKVGKVSGVAATIGMYFVSDS